MSAWNYFWLTLFIWSILLGYFYSDIISPGGPILNFVGTQSIHAWQPAKGITIRNTRHTLIETWIIFDIRFNIILFINKCNTIIVYRFLSLTEYVFYHHAGTILKLNFVSILKLKNTLSFFITCKGRCATQPALVLLMPVNLVIIICSIKLKCGYGWMMWHLLAI